MAYTVDRLNKDKEEVKTFLEHEKKKLEECEDEYTKKLLRVRVSMYERDLQSLDKAIENLNDTRTDAT